MTLIRKIYAGYAVAVVLLVILAGLATYDMVDTESGYTRLMTQELPLRYQVQELRFAVRDTIANMRGLLLYTDKTQEYVDSTNVSLAKVDAASSAVASAASTAGVGTDLAAQVISAEDSWHTGVSEVIGLVQSGDRKAAVAKAEVLAVSGTDLVAKATTIVDLADKNVIDEEARMSAATNTGIAIIVAIAALFIVATIVLAFVIGRSVRRILRDVTVKLTSSAAEMLAVSAQVATGASETATSISETTSTVAEVKQTAQLVNEKAAALMETGRETSRIVETGSRAVEETVAGIERMGEQMGVITDSILRLSDQTATISDVISTVNDLAEQSNLLSVNAAIEAAKAGDQGKGFVVVAQEVKNLADQSKAAVAQVRGVLSEIEKATTATVMATELGSKSVESIAEQSLQSGEAIEQLAESVAAAVLSIEQTAASTEQQLAGLDQIGAAMEAINEASAQNVAGTRQIEVEVGHLRDMADALEALIDRRPSRGV